MNEIPEDIMQAALKFARESMGRSFAVAIARALMAERLAERERCAKVAEEFSVSKHVAHDMKAGIFPKSSRVNDAIAAALRGGSHE